MGIQHINVSAAFIFATSGLLQIQSHMEDQGQLYFIIGGCFGFMTILIFFGIKDVDISKQSQEELGLGEIKT